MKTCTSKYKTASPTRYLVNSPITFQYIIFPSLDINTNLKQSLPLPLIHRSLAFILALPLRRICRVKQVVHIASHTAPAGRRCRINALEGESRAGQLPARLVAICVTAAAKASSEARSTTAG